MRKYKILKTLLALSVSLSMIMTSEVITVKATVNSSEEKLQGKLESPNSNNDKEDVFPRVSNEKTAALKRSFGLVKPTVKLPKAKSKDSLKFAQYASYYDLRTLGKVTSVKDQSYSGSCWAFATYGSLESKLLTGENRDFSENNLKNNSGFDIGPNNGGNHIMSTSYLARWSGPINESDDPYNPSSTVSPTNKPTQKHVQNVDWLSGKVNYLDNNFIKDALIKNGAVYTSFYYESGCFNDVYDTYYDSLYWGGANHAVTIVGWDDNFDRNKFVDSYNGKIPAGNGAFIVKNSWGTSWGNKGYFYVSYYDENFAKYESAVFNGIESTINYKSIYQYDPLGVVSGYGWYPSNTAWMSNVFTASASDNLSAVSFYTLAPDSSYEVYICSNYTGVNDLTASRVLKASGSISEMGYHTVKLSSGVPLTAAKKFAVIIKITTPGNGYPIPVEYAYSGYSSKATASTGQSYVSSAGSSWSDLASQYSTANVCIKAFTTAPVNQPPKVISTSPINGAVNVAVGNNVIVKFSEAILAGTNYGNITVKNPSGVVVPATKTISGDTLTINPTSNLFGNTKYTVTIPSGAVKDSAGAALVSQYTFGFTTGANTAPTVKSTTPGNLATNIPNYKNIYIKFSEDIFVGTNYNYITVKNASGTAIGITKSISGDTLLIHPNSYLIDNTKYIVTIPAGSVKDNQSLGLASQYSFSFTTSVNTAPIVVRVSLPSTALDYGNQINVKFSESIFGGTNYGNITVKNAFGAAIGITKTISGDTLIIDPKGNLAGNSKYTVTIPISAVKDSKGLALTSQYTFTFSITTISGRTVIQMINQN